ncbi:hypothetical protein ACIOGZ_08155 [Kitasatospora sp. NPDC088160]|uniref:hypothetical protein n=1 Tax=Kitasatospora sp. NPDC088160 TaxID=3364072 RepID=UPI003820A49C
MDFIITATPVSLAKSGRSALSLQEQFDNLTERHFEMARELDTARAKLAKAAAREQVWGDMMISALGRVEGLEAVVEEQAITIAGLDLFVSSLEICVFLDGQA